jgi:beta-galactosidase
MERRQFLKVAGVAATGAALARPGVPAAAAATAMAMANGPGERLSLDLGWRFHRGDIIATPPHTGDQSYASTKAGAAAGAAALRYDDSAWRTLDLPHDFVVEGPFEETANVAQGYRPKGVAWYRRTFHLDPADQGKHLEIQLDGVAVNATVWLNGNVVAHSWSAYSSIYIDITAFARFGAEQNVLAVRVDADPLEGWWYEGGGLYRHTWLVKRSPVHLITDGVYAHPRRGADGRWLLPVEATVANTGEAPTDAEVEVVLVDPDGKPVAQGRATVSVAPLDRATARVSLTATDPKLWSIETPTLYSVRTTVRQAGAAVDEAVTLCGFRTQRFDADKGFFLNDKPLKIQGVCIHQDHAGVGIALPDSIIDFRLRRLKALGCNAIRSSHNAPTRELLDAADRLGFLVMDENRLFNTSPDYLRLVEWMVRRDRNHPSIILWSVFNEEPLQGRREGYEMVRRMSAVVKRLDKTRPVTAAMNGGAFNAVNVSQAVDVVGFNYQIPTYDRFHAANPTKPITSSEDTSAVSTRGEYVSDRKGRHVLTSYDDEAQPWGATHRTAWKAIATRPFVAGAFVWTGFDYRGEPQPFEWPTVSSSFGIMDLCGFAKDAFYIHQAQWLKDRPVLHLSPHWNWPAQAGTPIRVVAMANTETVALILNGKLIGEQKVDPYEMNEWKVAYAPGRLEAVGKSGGKVVAHAVVETTGAPVALRLTPDRASLAGDGRDATPITVEALDAKGRPVPTANLPVSFDISGGRVIGLGNGDANSHEPEKGNARRIYNGLAQVIVQSEEGGSGLLSLRAHAEGLKPAEAKIAVRPDRGPPRVARPA